MSSYHQQFLADGFILLRGGIPPALLQQLQADLDPLVTARDTGGTSLDWRHQTILEPRCFRRSFVGHYANARCEPTQIEISRDLVAMCS